MNRFSGSYFNGIIYSNDRINNPPQMKAAVMGACKSVMVVVFKQRVIQGFGVFYDPNSQVVCQVLKEMNFSLASCQESSK